MFTWYLLVVLVNGNPQPYVYPTEQEACVAYAVNPGSHVYQISGRRDSPAIVEGDCVAVKQFAPKK